VRNGRENERARAGECRRCGRDALLRDTVKDIKVFGRAADVSHPHSADKVSGGVRDTAERAGTALRKNPVKKFLKISTRQGKTRKRPGGRSAISGTPLSGLAMTRPAGKW
jgi:hypothetical protein